MDWTIRKTNISSSSILHPQPQPRKSQSHPPIKASKDMPPLLPHAPNGPISTKFQDNAKVQRLVKRTSAPPVHPKSSKPWPGSATKPTGTTDELIKHMSNVPSYLQKAMHTNGGDDIQGKALNVGVLEWGALQRYTGKTHSASATTGVASLLSAKTTAPTPKQQQQPDHFRDMDPDHSSSLMHYRRSISRRSSENGTDNGEEKRDGSGRGGGNKCLSPYTSPGLGGHIEKVQRRISGDLFSDIQVKDQCARVPYSCPLPREDDGVCTTTTSCSSTSSNTSSLLGENTEVVSREFTTNNRNTNGLSARRSLVGPPPVASKGKMSMVEDTQREVASSKRGRQSPLRRMLDPLFKPRNTASASHQESTPVLLRRPLSSTFSLSNKKKDCHSSPNTCAETGASISSPSFQPQSNVNLHLQQVEKIQPLIRQALVQLAWKKGLPVFMLSSGESDILGATVRSKCISDSIDNPDFSYSIFTLQESKTKGGAVWIRQGNKGKKQNLVSNTIGEVRVSTSKAKCRNNSDICHVSREFVLVGPQLIPAANTEKTVLEIEMESPVNMELAAIVTSLPTNGCHCSKTASAGSVTAILPSGIHGTSTQGEPSPLIERWKTGGGCDCGGWDEGCTLSLLSLEFNSDGFKSNWAETQAIELFPQGHSKEEGHAFSMICFKEGLYTVEFKSSIPLLQAFAICISLLHSRTPVKQETRQEKLGAMKRGPPTSYMQCHPPLSPVGRA